MSIGVQHRAKLTFFETFIDRHIDLMGDSLLAILFCLLCIAIAGLLPCILTFCRHGNRVRDRQKRNEDSLNEKRGGKTIVEGQQLCFRAMRELFIL